MEIDIARLKALAQAATPGPWELAPRSAKYKAAGDPDASPLMLATLECMQDFDALSVGTSKGSVAIIPLDESTLDNAAYIAAANPAVVLELLAIIADRTNDVRQLHERAVRAEGIAASVLEAVTSEPNTVIVLRGAEAERATGICADIARILPPKSVCVVLPDGMSIEQVREADMRQYGWVREDADPDDALDDILPLAPRKPLVIRTREELEAAGHDAKKVDMMLMVQEHVLDIQRAAFPDFDAKPTHFAGLTGNTKRDDDPAFKGGNGEITAEMIGKRCNVLPINLPASLDLPDTSTVSGVLYNFSDAERYSLNDGRIVFAVENPVECSDFGHMIGSTVIINREMWLVKNVECFMHMPPWRKGERIGLQVEAAPDLPDSEGGTPD